MRKRTCSNCDGPNDRLPQRYCTDCHAANMRVNRVDYADLSPEQKKKANARSYAKTYRNRGNLKPQPCLACGNPSAEMHHPNYDAPLCVHWLCRKCHLAEHNKPTRAAAKETR